MLLLDLSHGLTYSATICNASGAQLYIFAKHRHTCSFAPLFHKSPLLLPVATEMSLVHKSPLPVATKKLKKDRVI